MARRLTVASTAPEPDLIDAAVGVLRAGGVVAYATDTLYGLAVDPRQDRALERLYAVKGRPGTMAVPLIAADLTQADAAGEFGDCERRVAVMFWPGPLSLVVPARAGLSGRALAGGTTVAVRVPDQAVARALAAAHGFCITATSANRSGLPAPDSADGLADSVAIQIDLLLDSGPAAGGLPSTIITFADGRPVLLRAGAVPWDRVLRSLE